MRTHTRGAQLKEGIEDWKRHKQDREVNNRSAQVLDPVSGHLVRKRWRDLRVGDVVKVTKDHPFPADLLLLSADGDEGACYIETANLDGETNLKLRKAMDQTKGLRTLEQLAGKSVRVRAGWWRSVF